MCRSDFKDVFTSKRTVFLVERPAGRIPETAYHETVLYYDDSSCRFSGLRSKTRMALSERKLRCWRLLSSEMCRRLIWYTGTDGAHKFLVSVSACIEKSKCEGWKRRSVIYRLYKRIWAQKWANGRCVIDWLLAKGQKNWEEGERCKSFRRFRKWGKNKIQLKE